MAPQRQFRVTKPGSRITSKDETRERLNYAIQLYEQAEESLSNTQAAKLCAISKATLYRRINGHRDQVLYGGGTGNPTLNVQFFSMTNQVM